VQRLKMQNTENK